MEQLQESGDKKQPLVVSHTWGTFCADLGYKMYFQIQSLMSSNTGMKSYCSTTNFFFKKSLNFFYDTRYSFVCHIKNCEGEENSVFLYIQLIQWNGQWEIFLVF